MIKPRLSPVGEEVTVTVTNDKSKYELTSLTMNGENIKESKLFIMPNADVVITAVFERTKYVLHVVEGHGNGMVLGIVGDDNLPWGTHLSFTVQANEYYVIDSVTANGTEITPDSSGNYNYTTTPGVTTIRANFKKQQFTVRASATTNGTITLGEPATLAWGNDFTINVKADPNYEINTVTVNGENVSVNNLGDYTFVMPTHDVTVSATFKKTKYTITARVIT